MSQKEANNEANEWILTLDEWEYPYDTSSTAWHEWDPLYSQDSFSDNPPSLGTQNPSTHHHAATHAFAEYETLDFDPETSSTNNMREMFETVDYPAVTHNQSGNQCGDSEAVSHQPEQDGEIDSSLANQCEGAIIEPFSWLGTYDSFQVEADNLQEIQQMPLTISGRASDDASGTPETKNISNGKMTSEEGGLATSAQGSVTLGPVPWNNHANRSPLHWLDAANGLLLNEIRTEGGSHLSQISSASSAAKLTPLHSSTSSIDVQQPSTEGYGVIRERHFPTRISEHSDLDDSFVVLGGIAENEDEKPKS